MALTYTAASQLNHLIPLQMLSRGESAEVGQLLGQPEQVHRLEELGIRRGQQVQMIRPGSPCIIRLGGQKLSLRSTDSLGILVRAG